MGEAMEKLTELLKELERKLAESSNMISCTTCPKKHKRVLMPDRPVYAARYCAQCRIRHPAREVRGGCVVRYCAQCRILHLARGWGGGGGRGYCAQCMIQHPAREMTGDPNMSVSCHSDTTRVLTRPGLVSGRHMG